MLTLMTPMTIIIADDFLPERTEEAFYHDLVLENRHHKDDIHAENVATEEEVIPSLTRQMMKDLAEEEEEMSSKNNFPHEIVVDTAGNENEDDRNPTRDDPCRTLNMTVRELAW